MISDNPYQSPNAESTAKPDELQRYENEWMRQTLTTNDESPAEDVKRPRMHRFTLTDLLTFVTAIPVCIGVIVAAEFTANTLACAWFRIDWYSVVWHFLTDNVGVPSEFVAGYVTFTMIDVPAWVCYAVIALSLGLIRSKWAFSTGVAFVVSIVVWDLMSDYFSGLHSYVNHRLVSLFGVVVAALCFTVARRIRDRSRVPDRRTGRASMAIAYIAIVAALAVSAYGWWLVELHRKAGLEAQELFRDIMRR